MRALAPLTPQQLARVERRLLHPPPGSRIEAARIAGVDLTLLVEQLRLSPAERVRRLEEASTAIEKARGAARRP